MRITYTAIKDLEVGAHVIYEGKPATVTEIVRGATRCVLGGPSSAKMKLELAVAGGWSQMANFDSEDVIETRPDS